MLAAVPAAGDTARAKEKAKEAPYKTGPLAKRAWAVTELVLERQLDPPARQQMLLNGLRELLRDKTAATQDLGGRVSRVTTEEQFAALLEEVWPRDQKDRPAEERETALLRGLVGSMGREFDSLGYLTPEDVKRYEVLAGNRYVGTGIQIRMDLKEGLSQIVIPFPGGPARVAGAKPNDLIVEVDGASMKGVPLDQVVKKLQGEEGTPVSMTVRQPGAKEARLLKMVRGVIPFSSVYGFRRVSEEGWSFKIDPDSAVGYLRFSELKASTLLELRKLEPLVKAEGVRGLVLDFRFTHGQEMGHAALVADAFLDGGRLWDVRDGRGQVKEYKADRDCLFRDLPLVALVGEQTGGLAAAVAGALQDNGRATLVGETPRAPAYVHTLLPLPDGAALRIPTGRIERPARPGKPAAVVAPEEMTFGSGVRPDQALSMDREKLEALFDWFRQQESPDPPPATAKPPEDRQLAKAVAVLRRALAKRDTGKKDKETP
jgi:carboxyl-terminal processing protease